MGISTREFAVAMQVYGAKRLCNCIGSRYNVSVPQFEVGNTIFYHSGSYYIVGGKNVKQSIFDSAMATFGEKYPGGKNYWYGEVHTIRGILTLSSMIEGKYSKEYIDKLTDAVYKELLRYPSHITGENNLMEIAEEPSNLAELATLVKEFDDIVNPFGNNKLKLKEPSTYLDKVDLIISSSEKDYLKDFTVYLSYDPQNLQIYFRYTQTEKGEYYCYRLLDAIPVRYRKQDGRFVIIHYKDEKKEDEVVHFGFDIPEKLDSDISLYISLKTGKAWQLNHEEEAKKVTKTQIKQMIFFIKKAIKSINNNIIKYISE